VNKYSVKYCENMSQISLGPVMREDDNSHIFSMALFRLLGFTDSRESHPHKGIPISSVHGDFKKT
jgi:hypothetical protein